MKQFFLFFLFSPILLNAQIPNGGFENWDSVGMHLYPTGWDVDNGLDEFNFAVRRSPEAYKGNYALHLASDQLDQYSCRSFVSTYLPNPFSGNNAQVLSFYLKAVPSSQRDFITFSIYLDFLKDGRELSNRFTWDAPFDETIEEYTRVEIPLPFQDYDLVFVSLLGSGSISPVDGCVNLTDAWIDEMQISEVVSTGEISESEFRILGNPVGDQLRISADQTPQLLRVLDLNGRHLIQDQHTKKLQVGHLAPGMYLLEINFENGRRHMEKWIKM